MRKEITEDPGKFASGEVGGIFSAMFFLPIISAILLLVGMFILGYTSVLGGPYGLFRVLFIISIIGVFSFFLILRKIYMLIKRATQNTVNDVIKVDSKVVNE